jgi:primosomal protein N' (replication factor Y)
LIRLVIRGAVESHVRAFAEEIAERLRDTLGPAIKDEGERTNDHPRILGPAPCPLPKLRGELRFQIHVQGPEGDRLRSAVRNALSSLKPPDKVLWTVDVDPMDVM